MGFAIRIVIELHRGVNFPIRQFHGPGASPIHSHLARFFVFSRRFVSVVRSHDGKGHMTSVKTTIWRRVILYTC